MFEAEYLRDGVAPLLGQPRRRTLLRLPRHSIELHPAGPRLVVTFEPFGKAAQRSNPRRPGWGQPFLVGAGFSVLAIKADHNDWYRESLVHRAITELRDAGLFQRYRSVATAGSSMGGFAALAFADLCSARQALAITPQATVDPRRVPWEARYPYGAQQDWDTPFADAGDGCRATDATCIVVDPFHALDGRHAQLIVASNPRAQLLRVPLVGHVMPVWLLQMDMLKPLMGQLGNCAIDPSDFHARARARRKLKRYYEIARQHPRIRRSARYLSWFESRSAEATIPAEGGNQPIDDDS